MCPGVHHLPPNALRGLKLKGQGFGNELERWSVFGVYPFESQTHKIDGTGQFEGTIQGFFETADERKSFRANLFYWIGFRHGRMELDCPLEREGCHLLSNREFAMRC